jgi:hypothetical protein
MCFSFEKLFSILSKRSPDEFLLKNLEKVFNSISSELQRIPATDEKLIDFPFNILQSISQMQQIHYNSISNSGLKCISFLGNVMKYFKHEYRPSDIEIISQFILWIFENCPNKLPKKEQLIYCSPSEDLTSLQPFDLENYSNNFQSVNPLFEISFGDFIDQLGNVILDLNSQNSKTPFLVYFINFINDNQSAKVNFRIYISFLVYLLNSLDFRNISNLFSNEWKIFLNPNIFPQNNTVLYDPQLSSFVISLLARFYVEDDQSRIKILNELSIYFQQSLLYGMTHFLPLLVTLLIKNPKQISLTFLFRSKIFTFLLEAALTDLKAFDLARHISIQQTNYALATPQAEMFVLGSIQDDISTPSILEILENAMKSPKTGSVLLQDFLLTI